MTTSPTSPLFHRRAAAATVILLGLSAAVWSQPPLQPAPPTPPSGYYRTPALANDTLVFAAEGDLWTVALSGGRAARLTSHPGDERNPVISPDGGTVAFVGSYEGPPEVFTMPVAGGLPVRRTFNGGRSVPVAWIPQNRTMGESPRLVVATQRYSTLPNTQLVQIELASGIATLLPLAQASDASFDAGGTLFFTRLDFQGSHTRRYMGGTAQNLWRLDAGGGGSGTFSTEKEATPLTGDYDGTSASPMFFEGRLYFRSDRPAAAGGSGGGVMNLWSMTPDGKDLKQHTAQGDYEVRSPSLGTGGAGAARGKIAYQLGADIWVFDIASGKTAAMPITLETDLDQMREKWVDKPMEMVTSAHLSADGERVAITARGRVYVAPRKTGRLVEATGPVGDGVRHRDGRFIGEKGERILTLSDKSGEVELWTSPTNGVGEAEQLTSDADVLRWEAVPNAAGTHIAHHDKNNRLWIYDTQKKTSAKIDESPIDGFADLRWSRDGRWLAYVAWARNLNTQIKLYDTQSGSITVLTSDRTASSGPAWDHKGEFLYFLSERNLQSVVGSPWGLMQPEPFFDKTTKVYAIALRPGLRSLFDEPDELNPAKKDDKKDKDDKAKDESKDGEKKDEKKADEKPEPPKPVEIDPGGIAERVYATPVPPGNYGSLAINEKAMFLTGRDAAVEAKTQLLAFAIDDEALKKREWKVETIAPDIRGYQLSEDGKSLMIRTEGAIAIIDAEAKKPEDLSKSNINLSGWKLTLQPREEWRQMYNEAWRLHRDYFYDRGMHGVDWKAVREKYAPLVDRVACRGDLSDVLAQMIAELSALHHYVVGGDVRSGPDQIGIGGLGAVLTREGVGDKGGWKIERIYQHDPDLPETSSPLARPGLDIKPGDVITMINGRAAGDVPDPSVLLRNTAGKQVLLHVRRGADEPRPVIVTPININDERELRYTDWELSRRRMVEDLGKGDIGYVHLQAMGSGDIADFTRQFYPVFNRKGLVIDVRHNGGGNIDSWVLARLMRKAWFYWQGRIGEPTWNMQYAFRGHMCVLCNERTGSDGEAFSEGFRRLGLGKVIGTRTWGGEIWLSFSNYLVDKGIASAAETGVYGPEGTWLIEGRGVEPDIVVDNLPVATFRGEDAQLKAAIEHLQQRLREQPVEVPPAPKRPDKSR